MMIPEQAMRRRSFLATALFLVMAPTHVHAEEFITLITRTLRGDPEHLGWSTLRVGFRVQFPAPASGRKFMEQRYEVIDAVERELERSRFDPAGDTAQRQRLERLIAAAVRRTAPRGSVSRVYDFWIEATR